MDVPSFIRNIIERQTIRKFYAPLPECNIAGDDFETRTFDPDNSYFEIRLSEMFLRNRGELFRDFLPMAIITVDFSYAGEHRVVPFVVSTDTLADALKAPIKDEYVELRNTKVAGPIPYAGGDVGLFVGLFRAQVTDYSRVLFDLVDKVAKAFDVTELTDYLKAGDILRDGLYGLFGMKQVELCLGTRDEFTDHVSGSARRFQSGYLAYIDAPENKYDARHLWSRDARLYKGDRLEDLHEIRDANYCLVAVDYRKSRSDHSSLPFHKHWEEIQSMIWDGQLEKADLFGLPALGKAVAQSPDLTRDDKSAALLAYKLNHEEEIKRYTDFHRPTTTAPATRGRGGGHLGPKAMMQKAAWVARSAGLGEDTANSLTFLADNMGAIAAMAGGADRIDLKKVMAGQLAAVRELEGQNLPDPNMLAEALALDAIDTFRGRSPP